MVKLSPILRISAYILGKFHQRRMYVKLNGKFFTIPCTLATFRLAHKGWWNWFPKQLSIGKVLREKSTTHFYIPRWLRSRSERFNNFRDSTITRLLCGRNFCRMLWPPTQESVCVRVWDCKWSAERNLAAFHASVQRT